jgi:hypothetical protein
LFCFDTFLSLDGTNDAFAAEKTSTISFRTFIDTKVLKLKVQPSGICIFLINDVWHQMPEFQTTMENLFQK